MHLWELFRKMISVIALSYNSYSLLSLPPTPTPPLCFCSAILLFTACSGWQHMGPSDCPVPHTGRVHYMLLI